MDTGAYSNMRRMLNAGSRPVKDAIRTEELINYFAYDYPRPGRRDKPFSIHTEGGPSPWNPDTHLLHIGIQGYEVSREAMPASNLVFLVDVSGSMQSPDKLELLKSALRLLVRQLGADDRVSLVVYAGASGVVLEPTAGDRTATIIAALDGLTAGGSTNGGAGIRLAYTLAQQAYIKDGINRVILATDGDFNVGTVDFAQLIDLVELVEFDRTPLTDIKNIGDRFGGAITAALFLAEFTAERPWAHLDIAGTAWRSGRNKGATGRPVPLLIEFLLGRANRD